MDVGVALTYCAIDGRVRRQTSTILVRIEQAEATAGLLYSMRFLFIL